MATKKQNKQNGRRVNQSEDQDTKPTIAGRIVLITFFFFSLILWLSLVSFDQGDVAFLSRGIEEGHYIINNWIGYVGAWLSWTLLFLFGFAAYPATFLFLLSCARRLVSRKGIRTIGWEYWGAFLLITLGAAMLLGIWPDFAAETSAALNIESLPGGVVGNVLCAPESGWLRIFLNPTGSAVAAGALIVIGLTVLWIYDWHKLFCIMLERRKAKLTAKREEENEKEAAQPENNEKNGALRAATTRIQQKINERKEAREKIKQELAGGTAKEAVKQSKPKAKSAGKTESETSKPVPSSNAGAKAQNSARQSAGGQSRQAPIYKLPPMKLLNETSEETTVDPEEVKNKKAILQETLNSFGIEARVGKATSGPRVTLFEVEPAPGVKVERISRISNNIAMELRAMSLRILTPIPGKKSVGIEVPNEKSALVHLRNLMKSPEWKKGSADIPLLLGRDISGKDVVLDLAQAPHLLIAGATGSGKSVCINSLILSLLYRFTPDELKMILVDPKIVEFKGYTSLPHLAVPVITEASKVQAALNWTIKEMERRYRLLASVGARNINAFNNRKLENSPEQDDAGNEIPEKLPYIIVIIDELADIMAVAKKEVEASLARIAQLSRAVGIHTIVATQRPSVNVITGIIKANFPTRIAFQVTSQIDSRTILDGKGAESLLGKGDMLYKPPGGSKIERNQGAMVSDEEIDKIVDFVSQQRQPEFNMDILKAPDEGTGTGGGGIAGTEGEELSEEDERLLKEATEIILRDRRPTTSYVQRCLRIGYNRAATIMELLEERGVVGPQVGTAPREILISRSDDDVDDDEETGGDSENACEDENNEQ